MVKNLPCIASYPAPPTLEVVGVGPPKSPTTFKVHVQKQGKWLNLLIPLFMAALLGKLVLIMKIIFPINLVWRAGS